MARQRLKLLEKVRKVFLASRCSGEAKARGLNLFDGAKAVFERSLEFSWVAVFLKVMALNLAKRGIACGSALRSLLNSRGIDLVATSECNIQLDSRATWVAEWRRHGWHVALSTPEGGWCKNSHPQPYST